MSSRIAPEAEGRTTAKTSARLRCSEESEVVSAGGQRGAVRIGQIGVQEKSSDSPLDKLLSAQPPDSKLLPVFFVPIHAVHGDERAEKGAQGIVAFDPVENLPQIVAGVGVGMERIAPAATAGVGAAGGDRDGAGGRVEQIERIPREVPDLESAVGVDSGGIVDQVDAHRVAVGQETPGRRGDRDRRGIADFVDVKEKGIPVGRARRARIWERDVFHRT